MENLVSYKAGDMFKEDFPKCDILSMGNILHDWNDECKKKLFEKAHNSLNENGIFMIIEDFLDDKREKNTTGMVMSLAMIT